MQSFIQTDVRLNPNQPKNGKYNLISIWFNKISKNVSVCNVILSHVSHLITFLIIQWIYRCAYVRFLFPSESGEYNLISVWFDKILKRFLCVSPHPVTPDYFFNNSVDLSVCAFAFLNYLITSRKNNIFQHWLHSLRRHSRREKMTVMFLQLKNKSRKRESSINSEVGNEELSDESKGLGETEWEWLNGGGLGGFRGGGMIKGGRYRRGEG